MRNTFLHYSQKCHYENEISENIRYYYDNLIKSSIFNHYIFLLLGVNILLEKPLIFCENIFWKDYFQHGS